MDFIKGVADSLAMNALKDKAKVSVAFLAVVSNSTLTVELASLSLLAQL